jgi:cobalt/nickel transport system permease protein
MHISEGVLSPTVLTVGAVVAVSGVAVGLRRMDYEHVPKVAVLASAFFVASLIHVRLGPSSVHLVLNGLAGMILGWAVFPAILVALFLQGILFQFGGITTLGINTVNMALPAVICFYLFNGFLRRADKQPVIFAIGTIAGALSVILSIVLMSFSLLTTGREFAEVAAAAALSHIPVVFLDGIITGSIVLFLRRVQPGILEARTV